MTTCTPAAELTATYDFTTTEISCTPGSTTSTYITTTASGAKTTTTYTYTSCTVKFMSYTSCIVATPSDCVTSVNVTSVQCNSFDYSECTTSLAFKALWISTSMDHTRCNFPTTVNSTSTDSGSTICCYWNGDYQKLISTTSIASMYLSSYTSTNITSAQCTIETSSGSSFTCVQATTASLTSQSPSMVFFTCETYSVTSIEACTTLYASCNSEVFTSSTSICCYYDYTTSQVSAYSYSLKPTTDRCCQIEFSLTFTTTTIVSAYNTSTTTSVISSVTYTNTNIVSTYTTTTTNTYTYDTEYCCRTNTYTCTSSDTSSTCTALLASSITSYTELSCDDTCISTCFLGMCWSQCSTDLEDSCINVAYVSGVASATMTMCGTAWASSVSDSTYTTSVVTNCSETTICAYIWPVDEAVCGCTGTCSSETCSTVTFSFGQWKDCYTTCSSGGGSTDDSKDEIKLNIFADADNVGEALEQGVRNLYIAFTGSWMNLD